MAIVDLWLTYKCETKRLRHVNKALITRHSVFVRQQVGNSPRAQDDRVELVGAAPGPLSEILGSLEARGNSIHIYICSVKFWPIISGEDSNGGRIAVSKKSFS